MCVKQIIFDENPDIHVTKKSGSILMYFHTLNDSTYIKLEKLLKNIDREKIQDAKKHLSDNKSYIQTDTIPCDSTTESVSENTFKLSNREKNIIKRREYEKAIRGSDDEDDVVYNDVFVRKK